MGEGLTGRDSNMAEDQRFKQVWVSKRMTGRGKGRGGERGTEGCVKPKEVKALQESVAP